MGRSIVCNCASPACVEKVNIVPDGIVVTFTTKRSAFIEGQFLYEHRDVHGNYPLDEDEDNIEG